MRGSDWAVYFLAVHARLSIVQRWSRLQAYGAETKGGVGGGGGGSF